MSRLATLLNQSEAPVGKAIAKLESLSGYLGVDIKLLSEIEAKTQSKIPSLGLDALDTTGQELYYTLLARCQADNARLSQTLGQAPKNDAAIYSAQLIKLIKPTLASNPVLALKKSVAKDLLRHSPPKKLMKHLGYRSIDSMLKRQNASQLYLALRGTESKRFISNLEKQLSHLSATSFERRPLEIVVMPNLKGSKQTAVKSASLVGAIGLYASARQFPVGLSLAIWQAAEQIKDFSFWLDHHQFHGEFGKRLSLGIDSRQPAAKVGDLPISWRVIRLCHNSKGINLSSSLVEGSSPLSWWTDTPCLATYKPTKPISLNLSDVAANYLNGVTYKKRLASHFQKTLWEQLVLRYARYPEVKSYILAQLDHETPKELLGLNKLTPSIKQRPKLAS